MNELGHQVALGDGIAVLTLEGNGYNLENLSSLPACIERLSERSDVDAIVLQGTEETFWIGASTALLEHLSGLDLEQRVAQIRHGQRIVTAILQAPKLCVAHVNGFAAGGGVDLMLACDLAFVTPSTRVNLFYSKLGVLPDHGALLLLADRIGWHRALRAAESSSAWSAEECVALGLADESLAQKADTKDWRKLLRKYLRVPGSARAALKAARWRATGAALDDHLKEVASSMATLLGREEQQALIRRVQAMQNVKAAVS